MIKIQEEDFSLDEETKKLRSEKCGAVCIFVGTVRQEGDLRGLEIEVYPQMAEKKLLEIERSTLEKFDVEKIAIIHRAGKLAMGENIIFIGVGAGHREAAFGACRFIIDEIKKVVPIWKKEVSEERGRWAS